MDTLMCRRATCARVALALAGLLLPAIPAASQSPNWRRVGRFTIDLALASPATGPVRRVWFSPDGSQLFAEAANGRIFESSDMENWSPAVSAAAPPGGVKRQAGTKLYPVDARRMYALSDHLYRTENGGIAWTNLTAFGDASVIGAGQHDLAISPRDPEVLVVANDYGVWRSVDGGLSWSGMNRTLPNLPARKILAAPQGLAGTRVAIAGLGVVEAQPGAEQDWRPVSDASLAAEWQAEIARRKAFSTSLGAEITAAGVSGEIVYAGASDGRIWISADRGQTWRGPRPGSGGAVEGFYADQQQPQIALAVLAGKGARVLRTVNTGVTWDDISSNLPEAAAHAIAVDRASGAVYAATDAGLFYATVDLERSSPAGAWTLISGSLPAAPAMDVKLDPGGNQLYAALDGYGVFAALAPHRAGQLRLVNAADFSAPAAAPGSLMSVLGGKVSAAKSGDLNFPVLDASENESQIQVPFEVAAGSDGSVSLALEAAGKSFTFGIPVQDVAPAIFVDRNGSPMVLDADSALILDARNAAGSGSRLQILMTGLGKVRPDWPTGMAAPLLQPPAVRASIAAYVDRSPVEVLSSTLAPGYIGLYLVEIRLPAIVNAGPAELYVTADGRESNRVRIQLQQ